MEIKSLSICVPAGCPNNCKFCVAKMLREDYTNQIEKNHRFRDLYKRDFCERLEFCRDNNCNTVILTGKGEPLYNLNFLDDFAEWNERISKPFHWIEIQTSGVSLDDEKLRYLRNTIKVSTISLSLSAFDNEVNARYNGTPEKLKIDIPFLCEEIKRYDFNLRLSLNMTVAFEEYRPLEIFEKCHQLGANQVTFRKLYKSPYEDSYPEQNSWIEENSASEGLLTSIEFYIDKYGRALEKLSFGATRYSIQGMSVVLDRDCMSQEVDKDLRYAVLRPNCKLYSKWDDEGSLIF